jgi:hypothetical protein
MANDLIPQHVCLAISGTLDGYGPIPNPFKQVSHVDQSDGRKGQMSDSKRNGAQEQDIAPGPQKFGRFQT